MQFLNRFIHALYNFLYSIQSLYEIATETISLVLIIDYMIIVYSNFVEQLNISQEAIQDKDCTTDFQILSQNFYHFERILSFTIFFTTANFIMKLFIYPKTTGKMAELLMIIL